MSKTNYMNLFAGYTGTTLFNISFGKDDNKINRPLFARFESTDEHSAVGMFFARATAIITAPILFAVTTPILIIGSLLFLFKALIDVCVYANKENAKDSLCAAKELMFIATPIALIVAIVSPFLEIADFVGALFNKAPEDSEDSSSTASLV